MTRIVVVGDTHVRAWDELHPALRDAVTAADIAVHVGDWVHLDLVEAFRRHAKRAVLVHGNSDPPELRRALPYREVLEVDGVRLGVTHPAWAGPEFPPPQMFKDFPEHLPGGLDAICFGHFHVAMDEVHDGMRFVNPGQGYPSFRVPGTLAVLTVADGALDVEIVEFAPGR